MADISLDEYYKRYLDLAFTHYSGGGGGSSGGNACASGHNGGACGGGGLSLGPCRCGQPATRHTWTEAYCAACGPVKRFDLPTKPEPTHCPCGAEFMGTKMFKRISVDAPEGERVCGDCFARPPRSADLDARIKAAAKSDADPTSEYGAWASPTWES